jgi:hypothetical protein
LRTDSTQPRERLESYKRLQNSVFYSQHRELFTSVLISMLEERGLIAYDDRIVKYLYDGGS